MGGGGGLRIVMSRREGARVREARKGIEMQGQKKRSGEDFQNTGDPDFCDS